MNDVPPADAEVDPVEELLAQCLTGTMADVAAAAAAACARHPEHADELRHRLAALQDLGIDLGNAPTLPCPGRLGRFHLQQRIGGGGMGVVHLAIEEPSGRRVALKLIRPEHLWFEKAHRRFLREAEAVARLSHPGIVPVHAAGEQDGVPFLVMEFVAGRSLAEVLAGLRGGDPSAAPPAAIYQADASDWPHACMTIARQIALALQHAHERGVVHRDVKPSNIMLDERGNARLIDFGLAHLADCEPVTRTGVQPGSLAYMSPEQVRGEAIDARTDVYSLGATLYELLALRMPFAGGSEEAVRHSILVGDPIPLDRLNARVDTRAVAIVATAMATERHRRYPSMAAFAADLTAWLQRQPVAARRPGALLRARRWARRRPAIATALTLGLLLGVSLPTSLFLQERASRRAIEAEALRARIAESGSAREATKANRVVAFLEDLFYESEPARARGEHVPARLVLDRGVRRIRDDLRDEPRVRAALLAAMGQAYLNLGLLPDAAALLDECELLQRIDPTTTSAERRKVLRMRAQIADWNGEFDNAERCLREALELSPSTDHGADAADTLSALAEAIWHQGRLDEGEQLLRLAVARLRGLESETTEPLAAALQRLAVFLQDRVDPRAAAPVFAESAACYARCLPVGHPRRVRAECNTAINLIDLGEIAAAAALLEQQHAIAIRVFDPNHPLRAMIEEQLAVVLLRQGRPGDALPHCDAALTAVNATSIRPGPALARLRNLECSLAAESGNLRRAQQAGLAALAAYENIFPNGSVDLAAALSNLTRIHTALGDLDAAVRFGRRALDMHDQAGSRHDNAKALARAHLAHALALAGRLSDAIALLPPLPAVAATTQELFLTAYRAEILLLAGDGDTARPAIDALTASAPKTLELPGLRAWALYLTGWFCNLEGRSADAVAPLLQSRELRTRLYGPRSMLLAQSNTELAVALARSNRIDEADELLEEAVAIGRSSLPDDHPFRVLPLLNLAAIRRSQRQPAATVELASEALRIQQRLGSGDARTQACLRLLLTTAPHLPDPVACRSTLETAAAAAAALLPPDHALVHSLAEAASNSASR